MIKVTCGCGASLNAKEELAGKRAKCPKCGAAIEIQLPTLEEDTTPLTFSAVTIEVGKIVYPEGYLSLSLRVDQTGRANLHLYVKGPGSRSKGELISLGQKQFEALKELVRNTENTIKRLQATRQMLKMIEG